MNCDNPNCKNKIGSEDWNVRLNASSLWHFCSIDCIDYGLRKAVYAKLTETYK